MLDQSNTVRSRELIAEGLYDRAFLAEYTNAGYLVNMNEADNDASTKAIDSLLNFETVKYFGNEEHEASRYDRSMERFEKAAVKTWVSLAVLNAGQALIYSVGLTVVMVMSAYAIGQGRATIGDFVMINALMIQLYMPLNFIGSSYREIKQGLIDVEQMFTLLKVNAEIKDKPGAGPLIYRLS